MVSPDTLAQSYADAARRLKAGWGAETPAADVDDTALDELATARQGLGSLPHAAVDALPDYRAFWINTYNGAVIDRAVATGVRRSVREVRGFFRQRWLAVAGACLSLDDVEHGFLRGNRRHPARLLPPLLLRPHLRAWVACPFDPRVHFALNCGGRSCPPLRHYRPDDIDGQLDLAAGAFVDGAVSVNADTDTIDANPILRWYRRDFEAFGGLDGLLRRYRRDGLTAGPWRYRWTAYDWSL